MGDDIPETRGLLGTRRGAVEAFLLTALKAGTQVSYTNALAEFQRECDASNIDFRALSPEAQDWVLAEYCWLCHEESLQCRQSAVLVVAAVSKVNPQRKYRTAHAVLEVWKRELPVKQAPALPMSLVQAIAVLLHAGGMKAEAMLVILCFTGVLRISEGLGLRRREVVVDPSSVILLLGVTKTGTEQKVEIMNPAVVAWVRRFLATLPSKDTVKLFDFSYQKFSRRLKAVCASLGFASMQITSHSLRRSGATELLRRGYAYNDICLYGRWSGDKSVREYLRRGSVGLVRIQGAYPQEVWDRVDSLAAIGVDVWGIRSSLP